MSDNVTKAYRKRRISLLLWSIICGVAAVYLLFYTDRDKESIISGIGSFITAITCFVAWIKSLNQNIEEQNTEEVVQDNIDNISNTENVHIKVPELSWWKKIGVMYAITKRCILDEFIVEDGILTVKCKNGKLIKSPIEDIKPKIQKGRDNTFITIKTASGDSIRFGDYAWTVTDEDWEQIIEILQAKETKSSKILGVVGEVVDFIK